MNKLHKSTLGVTVDGSVLLVLDSLSGWGQYCIKTYAGSVKLIPSLREADDNPTWDDPQLVLSLEPAVAADVVTDAEGRFAAVTSTANLAYFFAQNFRAIRVVQVGATPARVDISYAG